MAAKASLLDRVRQQLQGRLAEPFDRRVAAPLRRRRNAQREYRPIFVAGASGSGTSFLAVALGQRFDCAGVIYETNSQVAEGSVIFVPPLGSFPSVAAYQDHMTPDESWSEAQVRHDLLDMYRAYCAGPSDVVVDKGPDINLVRAAFLARCFPEGRFALIFRDPAANIEGLRRKWKTFGNDPLSESIRFYAELHEAFLDAAAALPGRVVAVEYEELVARPDATWEELGRRLGLEPARRRRRIASRPNVDGQGLRNVKNSRIGVVKDATRRALARLDPGELREIRAALDPLHRRLRELPYTL